MRALTISNGELLLEERPDPVPRDTELLVEVRGAGLNAADLLQRDGLYPAPPGSPEDIPGLELAGEVVGTGAAVRRFEVGDRVMAVVGGGAQAELTVVDESVAISVPDSVDWVCAGGFPEVFSTAYDALFTQCKLSLGERVLVTGAAGGVGTAAVQLAASAGAEVIASVRRPEARHVLLDLGAGHCVDPREIASFGPYDVVLELVGAASLPSVIDNLATGGRVAVIGVGSGARVEVNLHVLMQRRARIYASTLRARSLADKANLARAVAARLVPILASGRLHVVVSSSFAIERASEAYAVFASGGKIGKIVLTN